MPITLVLLGDSGVPMISASLRITYAMVKTIVVMVQMNPQIYVKVRKCVDQKSSSVGMGTALGGPLCVMATMTAQTTVMRITVVADLGNVLKFVI